MKKRPALRKLRRYIDDEYDGSVTAFARKGGLSRVQVTRLLRQLRGARVTVDLALDIEDATRGAVVCRDWKAA